MKIELSSFEKDLLEVGETVARIPSMAPTSKVGRSLERWDSDLHSLLFHLRPTESRSRLVCFLGGTGTGKSTLLNRLVDKEVSTTSFKRTFTSGAVAVAGQSGWIPSGWAGISHKVASREDLPVRGEVGVLTVVEQVSFPFPELVLVDTPDLDGELAAHHAEAERMFRWSDEILFLVTPEKYQMKDLLVYYRLARRYEIPCAFLLNKGEDPEPLEDYREQLRARGWDEPEVFSIPRHGSVYEPDRGLEDLKKKLRGLAERPIAKPRKGFLTRAHDLLSKGLDQIVHPLLEERSQIDRLTRVLREMDSPRPDLEVDPLTDQLQRRMREKSVLYLLGPQRLLERAHRLFAAVLHPHREKQETGGVPAKIETPDFWQILVDQFMTAQSRMDDTIRTEAPGESWIEGDPGGYSGVKIDPGEAGRIAEREIENLQVWLKNHWDANPRDTRILETLLKYLPGGSRLAKWTEAAPYLLILVCAAKGAFFGPIDLLVIGGFNLATWIGEKLSNEITAKAKETNRRILDGYAALVGEQIDRYVRWLEGRVPEASDLTALRWRMENLLGKVQAELEQVKQPVLASEDSAGESRS